MDVGMLQAVRVVAGIYVARAGKIAFKLKAEAEEGHSAFRCGLSHQLSGSGPAVIGKVHLPGIPGRAAFVGRMWPSPGQLV